ncbi:MAG: A/G-specific adenine glycosylase [Pseudomonadota bacterium]
MPHPSDLLDWYSDHARTLPWRVSPQNRRAGVTPDPYHVWLSEIMLQQTTVAAVKDYFLKFVTRWPTVGDLAAAEDGDVMAAWAGLGYYARARNLLKCARMVVAQHQGRFPASRDALIELPGVGPYTAAAIAAIAFDQKETVVDGNVERVMARLFDVHDPLPASKADLTRLAGGLTPDYEPGNYAQAVMDLGATICSPRQPACGICPWQAPCAGRRAGTAPELPKKTPKKPKPVRLGHIWVAQRKDGAWLLERRPERGLLGGMLGWPGTEWSEQRPSPTLPPATGDWQLLPGEVRHTFTHFHLRLSVSAAVVEDVVPNRGTFVTAEKFSPGDLPTVMRKAHDLTQGRLLPN